MSERRTSTRTRAKAPALADDGGSSSKPRPKRAVAARKHYTESPDSDGDAEYKPGKDAEVDEDFDEAGEAEDAPAPSKRGRGRPPKKPAKDDSDAAPDAADEDEDAEPAPPPAKKPRASRTKKKAEEPATDADSGAADKADDKPAPSAKRGRGRPPKNKPDAAAPAPAPTAMDVDKPAASEDAGDAPPAKRGRGRPPKKKPEEKPAATQNGAAHAAEPPTKPAEPAPAPSKPAPAPAPAKPAATADAGSASKPSGGKPPAFEATAYFFPSKENLDVLLKLLDGAKKTLQVCVFSICHDRIRDSLITAHKRGVAIRIICDDGQAKVGGSDVQALTDAGIQVKMDVLPRKKSKSGVTTRDMDGDEDEPLDFVPDDVPEDSPESDVTTRDLDAGATMRGGWSGGMMHNKFLVADGATLLTGSFNWTKNAQTVNDENFMVTSHPKLVRHFASEFDGIWEQERDHTAIAPTYDLATEGVRAVFFASEDSFAELNSWLQATKSKLDIAMYNLADDDLFQTLLALHKRGVRLRIIVDEQSSKSVSSKATALKEAGVPLKLGRQHALMHNKVAVRDSEAAITGSYNWTKVARFSDRENLVFVNHGGLVKQYGDQFEKLWAKYA